MPRKLVKRWQTNRGKHGYELHKQNKCYSYLCDAGCGVLGKITEIDAIGQLCQKMLAASQYDCIHYQEVKVE